MKPADDPIRVDSLMSELQATLQDERRRRLLARGGDHEYDDPEVYRLAEVLLRRATEREEHDALLLHEFLGDDQQWRLKRHLRFSSHRPLLGPVILFFKRRVLLPLTRWLYEYTADNFRRQQRLNELLISCVEQLTVENARLRRDLERTRNGT